MRASVYVWKLYTCILLNENSQYFAKTDEFIDAR